MTTMKFFDADQVHNTLPYEILVPALIRQHLNDVDHSDSICQQLPNGAGDSDIFLSLPAWQGGRALGAKLVTLFPANEFNGSGLPSVQAVFVLFDGANGRPEAVMDGTALTLRKTAADSAAGSFFLSRKDAKSLLVVGAGAMAPHLAMAHCAVRAGIERVELWNRTRSRAETLVTSLELPGVEVTVSDDLESSARRADIISCATMATEPLIRGNWLQPGAHLDLVGSFRPDMHECDTAALTRATIFVDSPWSALEDCGEILTALEQGAISRGDIRATLFDLARDKHTGRSTDDEITVFKNGGGGHLDLMVAQVILDQQQD